MSGIYILHQFAQRLNLVDRVGLNGIGIHYGTTGVAQHLVHGVRQRVDDGRLLFPRNDQACAPMLLEITCQSGNPVGMNRARRG